MGGCFSQLARSVSKGKGRLIWNIMGVSGGSWGDRMSLWLIYTPVFAIS